MKTEKMIPTQALTSDQQFFFDHAGYSYGMGESRSQGRTRGAVELATAEALFLECVKLTDTRCEWHHDEDEAFDCKRNRTKFDTYEWCGIHHQGDLLASLGAIRDADANYRRVIRAELAVECRGVLKILIANAKG